MRNLLIEKNITTKAKYDEAVRFADMKGQAIEYSKDASITLKLEFKCLQANELMVSAKLESKKPRGQSTGTKMYRDERGQLYMDDPNQLKLIDTRKVQSIRRDE